MLNNKWLFFCLCIALLHHFNCESKAAANNWLSQDVTIGGDPGNPGGEIAINKKGLDYISTTFGNIVNKEIQNLKISYYKERVSEKLFSAEVKQFQVKRFKEPRYYYHLMSDSQIRWSIVNAGILMSGNLKIDHDWFPWGPIYDKPFDAEIEDVTVTIIGQFSDGKRTQIAATCTSKIESLTISYPDSKWFSLTNIINFFGSKLLKPILERKICEKIKDFIEKDVNKKFDSFVTRHMLPEEFFYLDLSLLTEPSTSDRKLVTKHVGDISYPEAKHTTPFYPHKLDRGVDDTRMVNIFISDYVLNSFFYNWNQRGLRYNLFDTWYLITNERCGHKTTGAKCLGSWVPEIDRKYGNAKATFRFKTTSTPQGLVNCENVTAWGQILFQVLITKVNKADPIVVFNATLDVEASLKLDIVDGKLVGNGTISKLDAIDINTTLDLTRQDAQDYAEFFLPLFNEFANNKTRQGIPLTFLKDVSLINSKVHYANRTLQILTDVVYSN